MPLKYARLGSSQHPLLPDDEFRVAGPYPARTLPDAGSELSADSLDAGLIDACIPRSRLEELIEDEARFHRESGAAWVERCWFLVGAIRRSPGGDLFVEVERFLLAGDVHATAVHLEFGPTTWVTLRSSLASGQDLVGWIHTHSPGHIRRERDRGEKSGDAQDSELEAPGDGRFLSSTDIDSAYRHGFRAPWMLTAVLDADAAERGSPVERCLATWGFHHGILLRRSARLIP